MTSLCSHFGKPNSHFKNLFVSNSMCSVWVPHMLTGEQLNRRVQVCRKWLEMKETEPAITSRITTCDESWVHHYDTLLKQENVTWKTRKSSRKKKVRQTISAGKLMLIAFFGYHGIVYKHSVPRDTTINSEYYCSVLAKLREHVARKRSEIKKSWLLHHDNARPLTITFHPSSFTKMENLSVPASTLQSGHHPLWFMLFPTVKKDLRDLTVMLMSGMQWQML